MLDESAQDRIGRELRARYERMPGGIPERIWVLLLLEHDESARARPAEASA